MFINPYPDSRCPGCGRCKECGQPMPLQPNAPYWTIPTYPYTPISTTISGGSLGNELGNNLGIAGYQNC